MVAKRFKIKLMETTEKVKWLKKPNGGRPLKKVKKETGIRVRLSKSEHFLISEKSKKAGLKISDWVRQAAKQAKVVTRLGPEDLTILRMLSGMANNLNQLTKLAHQEGLLSINRKCREILAQIDDALKYLNRDDR